MFDGNGLFYNSQGSVRKYSRLCSRGRDFLFFPKAESKLAVCSSRVGRWWWAAAGEAPTAQRQASSGLTGTLRQTRAKKVLRGTDGIFWNIFIPASVATGMTNRTQINFCFFKIPDTFFLFSPGGEFCFSLTSGLVGPGWNCHVYLAEASKAACVSPSCQLDVIPLRLGFALAYPALNKPD